MSDLAHLSNDQLVSALRRCGAEYESAIERRDNLMELFALGNMSLVEETLHRRVNPAAPLYELAAGPDGVRRVH